MKKIIIIDNYDSFTYNLYDYFLQLNTSCQVVLNDKITIKELKKNDFDGIVLSPGPCTPTQAGITMSVLKHFYDAKPILGICLGHQAIGMFFGATLQKANRPMHGKTDLCYHDNQSPLFENTTNPLVVMRYHSLILNTQTILEHTPLKIIAANKQHETMAIQHSTLPIFGVQFHPESILSEFGLTLLHNWLKII